jgi:hypothetical protein
MHELVIQKWRQWWLFSYTSEAQSFECVKRLIKSTTCRF